MAFGRDTTAKNIKPLTGAIVRRMQAGATIAAGELVSLQSDGKVDPSDASATDEVVGVALAAAVDTDYIDVVTLGPVVCLSEATVGTTVWNSSTAGEPAQASSGYRTAAGYAESATILFVQPEHLA